MRVLPDHYYAIGRETHDVFLSHTTREAEVRIIKPFVAELIRYVNARAPRKLAWLDVNELKAYSYACSELRSKLWDAILYSRSELAFFSPRYLDSYWCNYEWRTAEELEKPRLPIVWKEPEVVVQIKTDWPEPPVCIDLVAAYKKYGDEYIDHQNWERTFEAVFQFLVRSGIVHH